MKTPGWVTLLTKGLLDVIWPDTCTVCGCKLVRGERTLCIKCLMDMPLTGFHTQVEFNSMHERLMCHQPVHRATAMFHYERQSSYAKLIHEAKYNGRPSVGRTLARMHARTLQEAGFFDGVDLIIPVPLNTLRLVHRGYNQSYHIGLGLNDVTGIPVDDCMHARRHTSQTHKNAQERLTNARGTYSLPHPLPPEVKHVLLVDDVLTTGATLCACAEAIGQVNPGVIVSVFTLASARLQ